MIRTLLVAIAGLAIAAPAASAHDDAAEIFATSNTAVITDQDDPRLDARLNRFADRVDGIIRDGGARRRDSELLDGVFVDSAVGSTTFERWRVFELDRAASSSRARRDSRSANVRTRRVLPIPPRRGRGPPSRGPPPLPSAPPKGLERRLPLEQHGRDRPTRAAVRPRRRAPPGPRRW